MSQDHTHLADQIIHQAVKLECILAVTNKLLTQISTTTGVRPLHRMCLTIIIHNQIVSETQFEITRSKKSHFSYNY